MKSSKHFTMFNLEALEPRVMMSAGAAEAIVWDAAVEVVQLGTDLRSAQDDVFLDLNATAYAPADLAEDLYKPLVENVGGEPNLPGLVLAEESRGRLAGQVFELYLDGGTGIDYEGQVSLRNLEVEAFNVPEGLQGELPRTEAVNGLMERLDAIFASSGVVFTTEHARDGPASILYVGGTDDAFSGFGDFFGLAEGVDRGNLNPADKAFVFSESIYRSGVSDTEYLDMLAGVVAHEAGRLMGYHNADDESSTGPSSLPGSSQPADGGDVDWLQLANLSAHPLLRTLSGTLTENDHWGNTIHVNGNLIIDAEVTIDPGTVIKVNSDAYIWVRNGSLLANGTEPDRVIFTSSADDSVGEDVSGAGVSVGTPGGWEALYIDGPAALTWAEIRFAGDDNGTHSGGTTASVILVLRGISARFLIGSKGLAKCL